MVEKSWGMVFFPVSLYSRFLNPESLLEERPEVLPMVPALPHLIKAVSDRHLQTYRTLPRLAATAFAGLAFLVFGRLVAAQKEPGPETTTAGGFTDVLRQVGIARKPRTRTWPALWKCGTCTSYWTADATRRGASGHARRAECSSASCDHNLNTWPLRDNSSPATAADVRERAEALELWLKEEIGVVGTAAGYGAAALALRKARSIHFVRDRS